ncbi:autotransporter outer membrane beta-barrel domain-containing protein [Pantoea septica]|uniref:autotransporter outer membrane beta-barrel domain-containing protein n=2 Tax=Pantoea septica TaxID=472695 RepID=UPI00289F79B4|nr:autotransporter outer membrane beta-barrel domain-containing protein [Pantoea septica]
MDNSSQGYSNKPFRFNKWYAGVLLQAPLYIFPAYFSSAAHALGDESFTINGSQADFQNASYVNRENYSFIFNAKKNGIINAENIYMNSTGNGGGGIWIENSQLNARQLKIDVSGRFGTGVMISDNSKADISGLSINSKGNAWGLWIAGNRSNINSGLAIAAIHDGTISIDSQTAAIWARSSELTLHNVNASSTGDYSYALDLDSKARATVTGGKFSTSGNYSDAIWIPSQDSSLTMDNAIVSTRGFHSNGINAQIGPATLTRSLIETLGDNSYGIYTENRVEGEDLTVSTSGENAVGLFTALGGTGELNHSTITTHGVFAGGVLAYPGSSITANDVKIGTSGEAGHGLMSRLGTLNISNSQISTAGEGASGLYVYGGDAVGYTNQVSLNNVSLSSARAQAIQVSSASLALEVEDSTLKGGSGQLMTVAEDKRLPSADRNVSLNAVNSVLEGDVIVSDPQSRVIVSLRSTSNLTGGVTNATKMTLDKSSRWSLSSSSSVGELINSGTIQFSSLNRYDTLNVTGNYAGDGGLLVMNSLLNDDASPANKLIIGGDVLAGTTRISVNNLGGHGAQTVEGIELVSVGGTSFGDFTKSERIVAGAYDYDVIKKGQSWYLTSEPTQLPPPEPIPQPLPEPTPQPVPEPMPPKPQKKTPSVRPEGGSYTANLAASKTLFMMTLHDRMGEPQFVDVGLNQPEVTSLWLRQVGGHNRWKDGSGQLATQSNRYVTLLGGDVARWGDESKNRWHLGFMAGYAANDSTTVNRNSGYNSKGSVKGYSVGSYATWYANKEAGTGAWLDSWLQYSWFNNDVSGQMLTTESYKSHGFTASLESGYTWKTGQFLGSQGTLNEWFIQPQAQVVFMGVRADNHKEANGTRIQAEGEGNWMTRLGVKTWIKSHHARDDGRQREFQPYVTLSWLHNTRPFATKMDDVRVSQAGTANVGEIKLGVEGQIEPRLNMWGNVGVQAGDRGYSDTMAQVGVKYHF